MAYLNRANSILNLSIRSSEEYKPSKVRFWIYADFFLSFDVTLHVKATDNIGSLVDQLVVKKKAIIE